MAHQQGGHRLPSQHNQHQGLPSLRSQYNTQPPGGTAHLRRTPSFDPGDDATSPGGADTASEQRRVYRPGTIASTQHEELYMNPQSPSYPARSASYGTSQITGGGYQHQDFPPEPVRSQPLYNPQQYGTPQSQHSPQPSSTTSSTFSAAAHQPYIPAAYQPSHNAYQSNYGGRPSGTSPQAYPPPMSPHPPPPPPRPYDHRHSNRVSPQIGLDFGANQTNAPPDLPYRQPLPSLPQSQRSSTGPSYTPPAPPPPPFSPAHDAFPSSTPAAPSQSYSQRSSMSAHQRVAGRPPSLHNPLPPLPAGSNDSPRIPSPAIHRRPVGSNHSLPVLNNSLPPTPGTPGPTPPAHSPQRSGINARHPHARPLPGPPPAVAPETDYFSGSNGHSDGQSTTPVYEDLMQEVEDAVMGRLVTSNAARTQGSIDEDQAVQKPFAGTSQRETSPGNARSYANGHIEQMYEGQYINYDAYSDRGDAEAEAGLAAMQMAEEQDALDEARRRSRGSHGSQQASSQEQSGEYSSGSDVHVDMDTYGGGFPGHVHYGDRDSSLPSGNYGYASEVDELGRPFAPTRPSQRSGISSQGVDTQGGLYDYPIPGEGHIHPFAPARVDRAGTGGLSELGALPRRLSFEDGDEATLAESETAYSSATQSPSRDSMPEMFFHPGVGASRPLPPAPSEAMNRVPQLMPAGIYQHPERLLQYDQYGRPTFPVAPDAYNQLLTPQGTPVPRSSSLVSHSSSPQTVPPIRSKTDADRARILKQQQMGLRAGSIYGTDSLGNPSLNPSAELLNLPEIPSGKRRKFNPSKLSTNDFKKCTEPWALSAIIAWVKEMSEGEADLKENAIREAIVNLFTHKVPTMNTADAEVFGDKVVRDMLESGTLLKDEEWVKFGAQSMSGVIFQLTGTGCYSPRVHTHTLPGRCYSHHCMRTLKKINLQAQVLEPQRKSDDWVTFYNITKSQIEDVDKKEVERQNILHEIVTSEDLYMDHLNVLRVLYRDDLAKWQPPILAPKRQESFLKDVFGKADAIKQVNEDYLLPQLKYRQQEQGPWIVGYSDIFREWIRKAKVPYIEYAASFPNASYLIRQESERNILFRQFLDQARDNPDSKRLGWDTYLKAPITRLQRYGLLLSTVHKNMVQDSEEKANLAIAMAEIKAVTLECDTRVADMSKNVDLSELQSKLQLRSGMANVHLNLTHLGREIIYQGDLQRMGSNKFSWVDTRAILFDHYMVLAKVLAVRDAAGGLKYEKYDVSKAPIPMDLLLLESSSDDPVVKSTMKGIGAVAAATRAPAERRENRQSISTPTGGPGTLAHTNTASSAVSILTNGSSRTLTATTTIDSPRDENLLWPFRVKHLGPNKTFTLYASTSQSRYDWCDKIIEAETRHASSLHKQNAEPFRLKVIADTAFANDPMSGGGKSVVIRGTPLDRAIQEVEEQFKDAGPRPTPVCRASVNCATSFHQPYGNAMMAVGTDFGVYISNYENPRGWTRAIASTRVTQIAVLEEFSLFLLISDKSLIAYHLDTVCPIGGGAPTSNVGATDSSRRAPQKLSGARDVGFFATGRMKDRTLVFYKKREGISSTFKVLEPVYQKSSTSSLSGGMRNRFDIRKGSVEFFRDFDDFYIPSETYAINLFHSSLAISTARGIEVLTLDKKNPFSIPDLKTDGVASIAQRIRDQRPLGMFRLSESEFLLVFEEVGIYVNKHGDVSRSVVLEFVGRVRQACLVGSMFLVLVDAGGGFVEVRNAINGRLRQVISGRDVRLLDDGANLMGGRVKICMQHPEYERCQVVIELVVNEGLKE